MATKCVLYSRVLNFSFGVSHPFTRGGETPKENFIAHEYRYWMMIGEWINGEASIAMKQHEIFMDSKPGRRANWM